MQPLILIGCITATTIVVLYSSALHAAPLVIVSYGMLRQARWVMIWLSTPRERELLGKQLEREPIIAVLRHWVERSSDNAAKPPP